MCAHLCLLFFVRFTGTRVFGAYLRIRRLGSTQMCKLQCWHPRGTPCQGRQQGFCYQQSWSKQNKYTLHFVLHTYMCYSVTQCTTESSVVAEHRRSIWPNNFTLSLFGKLYTMRMPYSLMLLQWKDEVMSPVSWWDSQLVVYIVWFPGDVCFWMLSDLIICKGCILGHSSNFK